MARRKSPKARGETAWWGRTRRLMIITLVLWAIAGFGLQAFVEPLDAITIAGFPLGYAAASHGALAAFVIIAFWFAARQERIDAEAGFAEPEDDTDELTEDQQTWA
ncbi:DUF4212 domain-containing protein [Stappia sp. F7233]|uniref:DUF4212 domain-containing protein n=1 Tax=Stappia albiluteola TaxID=2758565 RepID=A0A839AL14_9HYPH|nr:sodium/substrate symporter small subunit [Stappia albiluteola]MBA5779139.1 DUF4212 domain-containing protein [Stappia albiluteola]